MKTPIQLPEYRDLLMDDEGYLNIESQTRSNSSTLRVEMPEPTAEQIMDAAWHEEGTLNRENGHFLCNMCYIKAGCPSSPTGWRCP